MELTIRSYAATPIRRSGGLVPVGAGSGSVALSVLAGCADVSRSVMNDVAELVSMVFSGLSALVIEDAEDAGEVYLRAGEN